MAIGFWRLSAVTLAIGLPGFALAQAARPTQGSHPDFSGIYFPAVGPGMRSQTPAQLPYNDAAKKLVADYQKSFTLDDDPGEIGHFLALGRPVRPAVKVCQLLPSGLHAGKTAETDDSVAIAGDSELSQLRDTERTQP